MVEYDGLESYKAFRHSVKNGYVVCAFRTRNFGIYQVKSDGSSVMPAPDEPDIHMLPEREVEKIEKYCMIVYKLVFDAPAGNHEFDRNI